MNEEQWGEEMQSLTEHLEDLRRGIIRTLVVFVLALVVSFAFVDRVYHFLVLPLHGQKLTVLSPGEVVRVYFMIAGLAAVGITLPYAMYEAWRFVAPGLTVRERKITASYIPGIFVIFLLGISFGYFIVFPLLLHFLFRLASYEFHQMYTAAAYFGFMTNIVVPFGFLFEMPVIVMFLTRLGFLRPSVMVRFRKYAYLGLVILGSMISPPEFVSHLSVTIPMILLYEISLQISKWAYGKRRAALEEWEREPGKSEDSGSGEGDGQE